MLLSVFAQEECKGDLMIAHKTDEQRGKAPHVSHLFL